MVDMNKLLKAITDVREVDSAELSKEFKVSEAEIKAACKKLEEDGLVGCYNTSIEGDGFIIEATKEGREQASKNSGKKK
jgi:Mn-dependent DtxR family transcriptional regulator|tara:strand:+ start:216 stop:452 length:237 start_codon:yes stop_codon:yes gene_type:complete